MEQENRIRQAYELARQQYADWGIDTEAVLHKLSSVSVSVQCWQGDDVGGFETPDAALSGGGIQATGNYPGKARNHAELQADLAFALSLVPGNHRVNLHAIYGDFKGKKVDRDAIEPAHFQGWVDWAKEHQVKLDFNCTCFSHPLANEGFTLSSQDESVRRFWIDHVNRCREISAWMGISLHSRTIHNLWIPDGTKDHTVNRLKYRETLRKSLDEIFSHEYPTGEMTDSIESKLFGIGSEAFVVGSHEFYMGYGLTRNKMICIDMGHFHPTESVADKISSLLLYTPELMFHVSRGVRWDSDHVVSFNDELMALAQEIVRADALQRANIGLDFFDASINRIGAYVIGIRNTQKSLLYALLEPIQQLRKFEAEGRNFERLALLEEAKTKPFGAVWDYFCLTNCVPPGHLFIQEIQDYEQNILTRRS